MSERKMRQPSPGKPKPALTQFWAGTVPPAAGRNSKQGQYQDAPRNIAEGEFLLAFGISFRQISSMAAKSALKAGRRFKPHFRIYLGEEIAMGPGKADLLHHIARTGSISEAARHMDMSYNRAWLLVRTMNRCFKEPVVTSTRGGKSRGGASLTKTGMQVLAIYQQLESKVLAAAKPSLTRILSLLRK